MPCPVTQRRSKPRRQRSHRPQASVRDSYHPVSGFDPPDLRPHLAHGARHLVAQDKSGLDPASQHPLGNQQIVVTQPAGRDPYQRLARAGYGVRYLGNGQSWGAAGLFQDQSPHSWRHYSLGSRHSQPALGRPIKATALGVEPAPLQRKPESRDHTALGKAGSTNDAAELRLWIPARCPPLRNIGGGNGIMGWTPASSVYSNVGRPA